MTQSLASSGKVTPEPQEKEKFFTFQEYLEYEGEPDVFYELVKGRLVPMPASTHLHTNIAKFLVYKFQRYFAQENLDLVANSLATGVRTAENSSRIPDMVVYTQAIWQEVRDRPGGGVLDFPEKPMLVVEIVSSDRRNDYVVKRSEYAVAEIAEYWIVDPKKKRVRVFTNPGEEGYEFTDFPEDSSVISVQFQDLVLEVRELLEPPLVEELIKEEQAQLKILVQQAENERQRAEDERQRAEDERQRAARLAQRLREMGVDPEEIE